MNRRWVAGTAGLLLLLGLAVAPPVQQSEAAFTDDEYAGASFTAASVPTPEPWGNPQCSATNVVLLGGRTTIRWKLPDGSGYTVSDLEYGQEVGGLLNPILSSLLGTQSTTGTPSGYTTVITGGLLSNAIGGSVRFAMRIKGPGNWHSSWLVADATFPALLGTGTCTLSVRSS